MLTCVDIYKECMGKEDRRQVCTVLSICTDDFEHYHFRLQKDHVLSELYETLPYGHVLKTCPATLEWKRSGRKLYRPTETCTADEVETVAKKSEEDKLRIKDPPFIYAAHISGPKNAG